MKSFIIFLLALMFFTACNQADTVNHAASITGNIERISIPLREHGYSALPSKVITTQKEMNRFLSAVEKESEWNNKQTFLDMLRNAHIDFGKYNLLLYRMNENSGSINVDISAPRVKGNTVLIHIKRVTPSMRMADMAYYMLAYKVAKKIGTMTFDNGKQSVVIANKESSMVVPENCMEWYDGCNQCARMKSSGSAICTQRACRVYRPQDFKCTKWK
ncbi:hypothetical protein [Sulfurovum sp.]|uniref:hypothetical protein n=1 Tax=Sulfurovum sp. TaxID=1969726 RepID=UPI0025E76E23|nr:hypothetical protein [Sulfurovum sp.]